MNRRLWITLVFALAVAGLAAAARSLRGSHEPLETVPFVDLTRYSGKWHEIARFPNRFQRNCIGETTAIYTLQDDGTIAVLNQCRKRNGSFTSARGRARVAGGKGPNSKLKVTFFWPFRGDYWIIDLDPDYQWAVVGEPRRRYLWILGRAAHMEDDLYDRLVARLEQIGYDTSRLIRTETKPLQTSG